MGTPESASVYCQRRANETGRAYFVTSVGHCLLHCAHNLQWVKREGMTVEGVYRRIV